MFKQSIFGHDTPETIAMALISTTILLTAAVGIRLHNNDVHDKKVEASFAQQTKGMNLDAQIGNVIAVPMGKETTHVVVIRNDAGCTNLMEVPADFSDNIVIGRRLSTGSCTPR